LPTDIGKSHKANTKAAAEAAKISRPTLNSDPSSRGGHQLNRLVARYIIDGVVRTDKPDTFIVDSGADYSVISIGKVKELSPNFELIPWQGKPLLAVNSLLNVLGEWISPIEIAGIVFPNRWCVIGDDTESILGLDFIAHYKLEFRWSTLMFNMVTPSGETIDVPIHQQQELRTKGVHTIKAGTGRFINCEVDGKEGMEVVVEPAATTNGALRVLPAITKLDKNEDAAVFIANNDDMDVTILSGALIGYVIQSASENEIAKNSENSGYSENVKNSVDSTAKVLALTTESYREHIASFEKENVSNARIGNELNKQQRRKLATLLETNKEVFAVNPTAPRPYNGPPFYLDTGQATPFKEKLRNTSPLKEKEIAKAVEQMLRDHIIEQANSPWASPVVLAKKKDGTYRFCVDYRRLNSVTRKDSYALPPISTILNALGIERAKMFTTLDVASGFWHINIHPPDREKTAFVTSYGTYQFRVVPFGLTNAPAQFCRAMDETLRDLLWNICLVFVDDIIIWSEDFDTHLENLQLVFDRLIKGGWSLKLSKCQFCMTQITYLGYVISEGKLQMDPEKIRAIVEWPPPQNLRQLQGFMGAVNWNSNFIKDLHSIAAVLHKKLSPKDNSKWTCDDPNTAQGKAFQTLKKCFMTAPILRLPDFDRDFYLITDASDEGSGAVLAQEFDGFELPVSYYSKSWKNSERSAHSYLKETRAMVRGLKHYKHYFWGISPIVVTDCRALAYWNTTKEIPQVAERYLSYVQTCMPRFIHRPGTLIPVTDALSRWSLVKKREEGGKDGSTYDWKLLEQAQLPEPDSARIFSIMQMDLDMGPIRDAQLANSKLTKIISYLKNELPTISEDERRELQTRSKGLELLNGLLVKSKSSENESPLPYIPGGELRRRILQALHNDPIAGHLGIEKTLKQIQTRFYWSTLKEDVTTHVRTCRICASNKPKPTRKSPLNPISISGPWLDVHLDYMEMPSGKEFTHLLVIVDRFTRMVELNATEKADAVTSANIFEENVLLRYGTPITVTTDGGSHFKGEFSKLLERHHITHQVGLPDTHRANGFAERVIRSIREFLRHYSTDGNWHEYISKCRHYINTAFTSRHGSTPYFVYTGRHPRLSIENELKLPAPSLTDQVLIQAKETTELSQELMKDRYDKTCTSILRLDDFVIIRNKRPSGKLDAKTFGPYKVVEVTTSNLVLENPFVGKDSRFEVHKEDAFAVQLEGKGPIRELIPSQELDSANPSLGKGLARIIKETKSQLKKKDSELLSYLDLIGERIEIHWTQAGARGWWKGTVVDYEPRLSRFWVKYDVIASDGTQHYTQDLLSNRPGKWRIIKA
jgi:hypothetical protein